MGAQVGVVRGALADAQACSQRQNNCDAKGVYTLCDLRACAGSLSFHPTLFQPPCCKPSQVTAAVTPPHARLKHQQPHQKRSCRFPLMGLSHAETRNANLAACRRAPGSMDASSTCSKVGLGGC